MRLLFLLLTVIVICPNSQAFDPANQDDSQALVRHFEARSNPVGPRIQEGSFKPLEGETVSLMGGTMVFQRQDEGSFELALQRTYPDKRIKVRNLGWPADTVYRQQRPMYFYTEVGDAQEGSLPDIRQKVEPGTFLLQFGQIESLDGLDSLGGFIVSYEGLLDGLLKVSERIILVQPPLFSREGPAAALVEERNEVLSRYREAILDLARRRGLLIIESFDDLVASPSEGADKSLRAAILQKNHLWDQYYRPTNWAFLFGDRQHVPSSRDHRDANRRWFVEELEKLPAMISEADELVWSLAKEGENE